MATHTYIHNHTNAYMLVQLQCTHNNYAIIGFEADLQEVWSVRKNIHHSIDKPSTIAASTVNTSMASTLTAGKYSRHGAFPARQSQGPKDVFNKGLKKKKSMCSN